MDSVKTNIFSRAVLWSDNAILVYLALVKLMLHLLTANNYGYFGDELYWLAMSRHLDFGYVDVPPLVAYLGAFSRWLIGDSLFAIHILPAIAGAVMVYFAGLIAREMGGGRFAQWFTALMVIVGPGWLILNSWFAYDPFDQLFSIILLYLVVLLLKQETSRRWISIGIIIGLGIMVKLSMMFLGFGLVVAWFLTNRRKSFITIWPWLAALIAIIICTPFMAWQSVHGWPLIKYWHNYAQYRNSTAPLPFIFSSLLFVNPFVIPVVLVGLYFLLFHREGKKYRVLGLTYLVLFVFFVSMKFEARMLASAHFPLLAAGAVWLGKICTVPEGRRVGIDWIKPVYTAILLISSILIIPLSLPVLPITAFEKYFDSTPDFLKKNIPSMGNRLPFQFTYRFGWPEMVRKIADVYHGLPEADQKKCVIWTSTYAEAGAIDLLGKNYGLPGAISNQLAYQIWGPGQGDQKVVIVFGTSTGFSKNGLFMIFEEVTQVATIDGNRYGPFWERFLPVYVCRKPRTSLKEVWPRFEFYY
jgi:hypothetical protein